MQAQDAQNILLCRNVRVSYGGRAVVDGVSFGLERGDYLCVVGENGSGKTSLMKGILGLLPLTGGSVELARCIGHSHAGYRRAGHIGYLPQQTAAQRDFPASVREVVLSGRLNRGGLFPFYTRRDRAEAAAYIDRLGLPPDAAYRALSDGQKRRVLLARALCAADGLLMLDEPAAGLDPVAVSEMYGLLTQLNSVGMTIVVISHDIESAARCGNKILHMKGRPLFFGTSDEYVKTALYSHMTGHSVDGCPLCDV